MNRLDRFILLAIQAVHWIYLILCGASAVLVVLLEPFWVSVPITGWIMYLAFSRVLDCPWTRLENHYRSRTGHPEIKTFIGHNIVKPYKKRKHA
tara:strand:+ start:2158 stop:2439 length:282 start_codon:yes stop_codon:yes gene_type:complete